MPADPEWMAEQARQQDDMIRAAHADDVTGLEHLRQEAKSQNKSMATFDQIRRVQEAAGTAHEPPEDTAFGHPVGETENVTLQDIEADASSDEYDSTYTEVGSQPDTLPFKSSLSGSFKHIGINQAHKRGHHFKRNTPVPYCTLCLVEDHIAGDHGIAPRDFCPLCRCVEEMNDLRARLGRALRAADDAEGLQRSDEGQNSEVDLERLAASHAFAQKIFGGGESSGETPIGETPDEQNSESAASPLSSSELRKMSLSTIRTSDLDALLESRADWAEQSKAAVACCAYMLGMIEVLVAVDTSPAAREARRLYNALTDGVAEQSNIDRAAEREQRP